MRNIQIIGNIDFPFIDFFETYYPAILKQDEMDYIL